MNPTLILWLGLFGIGIAAFTMAFIESCHRREVLGALFSGAMAIALILFAAWPFLAVSR